MQFWYVRHPFNWYKDNRDKIELAEPLDANWRKIRRFDKVVYFSHEKPKGIIGLFNVESSGDWIRYRGVRAPRYWYYRISPLFLANGGVSPMKFSPKNDVNGVSFRTQGTVASLNPENYRKIKEFLLGMPEPENHEGLVYLFARTQDYVQSYLGFRKLKSIQTHYPDAIALDERGKEMGIEFEYDTVFFDHDPKECDMIICWKDGLGIAARPAGVKVVQLQPLYGSDPTLTEASIS